MAIKKQLKDKDGNTIYPDVGLNLDDVVYSDDPTEEIAPPTAWVESGDINFSTFSSADSNNKYIFSGNKSIGNSWTDFTGSYEIPHTGLYFILLLLSSGNAGSTSFNTAARVLKGSTSMFSFDANSIKNYAGNNFTNVLFPRYYWLNKGDILKVQGKNSNWTGTLYNATEITPIFWLND